MCYLSIFHLRGIFYSHKKNPNPTPPHVPCTEFLGNTTVGYKFSQGNSKCLKVGACQAKIAMQNWRFVWGFQSIYPPSKEVHQKKIYPKVFVHKQEAYRMLGENFQRSQREPAQENFVCSRFLNWGWNLTVVSLENCDCDTGSISWCTASG